MNAKYKTIDGFQCHTTKKKELFSGESQENVMLSSFPSDGG